MNTKNDTTILRSFDTAFQSLDDMRDAHRLLRQFSRSTENGREQILEKIQQFLQQGVQLGGRLDLAADRDHAQGILDYWASLRETDYRDPLETRRPSSVQDAVLVPFNRDAAMALIAGGERVLEKFSSEDRELACRIMVRMVHLDPKSRVFSVGNEPLTALRKMAEPNRVDSLIQSLETVGVLRRSREENGDQLTLGHESLMRRWTPLSEALAQRLRFREAAEFWEAHDRDSAALLSAGPLLEEALAYRDMGELEREFADASREKNDRSRTLQFQLLAGAAIVLSVGSLLLAVTSILAYSKNTQLEEQTEAATTANLELKKVNLAISSMNSALVTKQNLSIVVQMAGALAEIEASDQSAERELSRKRLNLLVREYPEIAKFASGEFHDRFSGLQNGTESSEDRTSVLRKILNYGRILKAKVLEAAMVENPDNPVLKVAWKERSVAFDLVQYCTEQIVSIGEQKKPIRDADRFVVEFWKLYWADLAFVEQDLVENAMVGFGRKLNEIDTKRLEKIPARVSSAGIGEKDRAHFTDRQFAQTLIASSTDDSRSEIDDLSNFTLSQDDVNELRSLAARLKHALDKERQKPCIPEKPLQDY